MNCHVSAVGCHIIATKWHAEHILGPIGHLHHSYIAWCVSKASGVVHHRDANPKEDGL